MAGRSAFGTVTKAGMAHKAMSGQDQRGQGGKNTVSGGRMSGNPSGTIKGLAGRSLKGPDLGTGRGRS